MTEELDWSVESYSHITDNCTELSRSFHWHDWQLPRQQHSHTDSPNTSLQLFMTSLCFRTCLVFLRLQPLYSSVIAHYVSVSLSLSGGALNFSF